MEHHDAVDTPPRDVLDLWSIEPEAVSLIAGGRNSTHWRAQSPLGPLALRRYGADTQVPDAGHEHRVLRALTQCGVPVPLPLSAVGGATLIARPDGLWSAFEWAEGSMVGRADAGVAALAGQTLARAHQCVNARVGGHSFQPLIEFADTRRWGGFTLRTAASAYLEHDARRGGALFAAVSEADRLLDPVRTLLSDELVLNHADFHPENIRVTEHGLVVLDWAFAHLDHRSVDLGIVYRLWPEKFDGILDGYEALTPLTAPERDSIPLLAAVRGLDHVADRVTRWAAGMGPDPSGELDIELPDWRRRLDAIVA